MTETTTATVTASPAPATVQAVTLDYDQLALVLGFLLALVFVGAANLFAQLRAR
ncbi:hypothetical protein [Kineococcus sp. SYSU DK018]|uniref:hypothetical protein n=1 Tax=Kineococcus sp. SYSU DK018 TaxID=3383139 RepID=UPI003D7DECDA